MTDAADPAHRFRSHERSDRALAAEWGPPRPFRPVRLALATIVPLFAALMLLRSASFGFAPTLATLEAIFWRAAPVATLLLALLIAWPEQVAAPRGEIGWGSWAATATVALASAMIIVYGLNADLDRSEGVEALYPVIGKGYAGGDGARHYAAYAFDATLSPPKPGVAPLFMRIPVWDNAYAALVVGRSGLVTRVHPGAFGMPWYERDERNAHFAPLR